jgi:hypothetical protein
MPLKYWLFIAALSGWCHFWWAMLFALGVFIVGIARRELDPKKNVYDGLGGC